MNTSKIDFAIYDTALNIGLVDMSTYNPDLAITEPVVTVIAPNFATATTFVYIPKTVALINTATFGWCAPGNETSLADGVYTITMAVNPHAYCFKKVNYLRIFNVRKQIYTIAAEAITKRNLNKSCEVMNMLQNLEIAQHLVSDLCTTDSYEKGIIIYNSVLTDLTKHGCINCFN